MAEHAKKDTDKASAAKKKQRLRAILPDLWELIEPRKWLLGMGLLLIVINRVAGLVLPASFKWIIDDVVIKKHTQLLPRVVGAVVLSTVIQALTSFALTQSLSKAAQRLITDLRRKVQKHISRLPVAYYDANKTGSLVSRIMQDVEGVRNLIGTGLVELIGGLLTATIVLIFLFQISARMTALAAGFLAAFTLALRYLFRTIRPIFRERAKINAEVSGRLTESLGGVRVVKGYYAEAREEAVFSAGVQRLLDNVLRTLTVISSSTAMASILIGSVGAMILYLGGRQMLAGVMSPGNFTTYNMFLVFLVAPIMQMVAVGTQLTEAIAGLERTREILNEAREDTDPRRTTALPEVAGLIRFDGVEFAYGDGPKVLHSISFDSRPGTVTALVGSSGSGKSTIIGLVAAFHSPVKGTVTIDGVDLSTVRLDSYRTRLGVVLQDSFLFDGTIYENVSFSRPDATREQILSACKIARVDEFAERLEKSYDTVVGERGVKLSGGQRQRISIARAILADPRVLILDEATSSLDSESEQMIQEGLSYLMRGRTTFVIAHRLSTIRRADQILVVEAGEIVERGTHDDLLAANGRYAELYRKQHGLEANLFLAPGEGDSTPEGEEVKRSERELGATSLLRGPLS